MLDRLQWRPNLRPPDLATTATSSDDTNANAAAPSTHTPAKGLKGGGTDEHEHVILPSPLRSHRNRGGGSGPGSTPAPGTPEAKRLVKKKWTSKRLVLMDAAKKVQALREDQGEEGVAAMKIQGTLRQKNARTHSMKVKKTRAKQSGVLRSMPGAL